MLKEHFSKKQNITILTIFIFVFIFLYFFYFYNTTTQIRIISFNDFHATLENKEEVGAEKFFNFIKDNTNKNTVIVSAGDNFQGELLSNYFFGLPVIEIFKKINLFFSTIGNHEFDWGIEKINNEWKEIKFLSANILKNKNLITKPYIIKKIKNVKIGFIGLTTEETLYKVDINKLNGVEVIDPVITAKKYVEILKKQKVDFIVLVCHIGTFLDNNKIYFEKKELEELTKIKGVNLIITAHYHEPLLGKINNVFIIQSGNNGRFIGISDIVFKNKKIKNIDIKNINLLEKKDALKNNKEVKKILEKYNKKLTENGFNKELFYLDKDLYNDRNKLSNLGIFICKKISKITDTDIVILNSGSFRKSLFKGNIKTKDIYEILPFKNNLLKINIKGEYLIKNIINHKDEIQYSGFYIKNNEIFLNNNEKINNNKYYNIIINDFMYNGGDNYNFKHSTIIKNFGLITDKLIEYFI